jgi:hypothetical protein
MTRSMANILELGVLSRATKSDIGRYTRSLHENIISKTGLGSFALPDTGLDQINSGFTTQRLVTSGRIAPGLYPETPGRIDTRRVGVELRNENGQIMRVNASAMGTTDVDRSLLTPPGIIRNVPLLLAGGDVSEGATTRIVDRLYSGLAAAGYIGKKAEEALGVSPDYGLLREAQVRLFDGFPEVKLIPGVARLVSEYPDLTRHPA